MTKNKNKRNYLNHLNEDEKLFISGLGNSIANDRKEVCRVCKEQNFPEFELFDLVCSLFIYFLERLRRKKPLSRFDEALLILASKMISDVQCIKLALENGWTGTAMGISRMSLSALNMIMFLAYYPEYLEEWFLEKHDTYQKNKKFQKLFGEGNLLKKLAEKGFVDTSDTFRLLSKGTHASYWGIQVYTDEGHVTYQPRPDIFKTLTLLSESIGTMLALVGWYAKYQKRAFQKMFRTDKEQIIFTRVNARLSQACNHLTKRLFFFLADTQKEREDKMGKLLGQLDLADWNKMCEEIIKKGDPPLD